MVERSFPPSPPLLPPVRRSRQPVRSVESRVFWGVLCALLVFSGLCWFFFAIGVFGVRVATVHAVQQAQQEAAEQLRQVQQQEAERMRYTQAYEATERARHVLAPDQRCVGGAVVQVDGNTYTQIGTIEHPVHCAGRMADVPLR